MDCKFIESLTEEQKETLRQALEESDKKEKEKTEKYSARVRYYSARKPGARAGDIYILETLEEFLGNKKHGLDITWYKNGQKATEYHFVNDTMDGPGRQWWPNGSLKFQGTYVKGSPRGEHIWYNKDGTVLTKSYIE